MADLIIQPKNDDHLKLNNDAGTTILEFVNDESKLRLAQNNISASDGTTAITTSGANVTLAGTANNIGTVTSGTFNGTIGSSATFPAGHVINTVGKTSTSNSDTTTTSEDANISGAKTNFQQQITITSGNKVLVHMTAIMSVTRTATDVGAGLGIRVDQGSGLADLWIPQIADYITTGSSESWNRYFIHTLNYLHTPSNTTPTYQMYISVYGGTTRIRATAASPSIIILQEIQS